jgi:hypothetical protein
MLELNRTYWSYDNGDWWRPTPYRDAYVTVPRYRRYGPSIRHDLFSLVEQFSERYRNRNFYIAMSGGIDSEITAETFYQLGIPFEAISLSLFGGKNSYDLLYVKEYCQKRNIRYTFLNLDINDFISSVIPKAIRYGQFTHSLSQIALTYLFEVMTDKDILIFSGHNPDICSLGVGWFEDSPNLVKYAINTDKNFFTFTSLEPIFMHYLLNYDPSQPGDKDNSFIYNCYPNLKLRTKKTGWETLSNVVQLCDKLLSKPILPDGTKGGQVFLTWK